MSLQKGLTVCEKHPCQASCSGMLDDQPATVYPASPDDPSHNLKFGIWWEHHCIYFLTIVFFDNCRCLDYIWPDMSTKKYVLDDGTNVYTLYCRYLLTNRLPQQANQMVCCCLEYLTAFTWNKKNTVIWAAWPCMLSVSVIGCKNEALKSLPFKSMIKCFKKWKCASDHKYHAHPPPPHRL